jgi:hypothetical protein
MVSAVTISVLYDTPVRSPSALTARWATLLDLLFFRTRRLWFIWLDIDGWQSATVIPIDGVPPSPTPEDLAVILRCHAYGRSCCRGADAHLAIALCRPGEPDPAEDDFEWADRLREAFDDVTNSTWSLHLAAGGRVEPLVEAYGSFFARPGRIADGAG